MPIIHKLRLYKKLSENTALYIVWKLHNSWVDLFILKIVWNKYISIQAHIKVYFIEFNIKRFPKIITAYHKTKNLLINKLLLL